MSESRTNDYLALKLENERRMLAAEASGAPIVDSWPAEMVFEFTAACNLHCFMCGYEMLRDELRAQGRTKFTLPVETFRLIAQKAFPHVRIVNPTTSGEPFMLPYFDELIDTVARYGCKLEIVTNGMLLRGERIRRLLPHLACLVISFDGATKATFEHVRTGANFEQVLENLAAFSRLRRELGLEKQVRLTFNVTLLAENVRELPEIVEIAAAHGVDGITASYMVAMSTALRASSPVNCPAETNAAVDRARATAERLGIAVSFPTALPLDAASTATWTPVAAPALAPSEPAAIPLPMPEPAPDHFPSEEAMKTAFEPAVAPPADAAVTASAEPEEPAAWIQSSKPKGWKGKFYCNMPWRRIYVGQEGEAFPCCSPVRPVVGNVFHQDFEEIWNGEEYRRLRSGLVTGDLTSYCQKCPFLQQTGDTPFEDAVPVFGHADGRRSQ